MLERKFATTVPSVLVLTQVNSFVEMFLRAGAFIGNQEVLNIRLAIREALGVDWRTHNRPTWSEVAVILFDNMVAERDILHRQGSGLQRIKADSHIACRAHAVPLPCRVAKGLECVFPI